MKKFFSWLVLVGLILLNASPALAQLGNVTPPPVEAPAPPAPPAVTSPAPTPAPVPEPTVTTPTPEAAPEVEGAEPEVQTTVEIPAGNTVTNPVETSTQTTTETATQIVAADATAPVISGVADLSLGLSEATIVWTTDELATSRLEYGTTQSYGSQATIDATALLAHAAIILGLSPNTTYYYCIHATDLSHNTRNSCGHSFRTSAAQIIEDTTPPDVTLITIAPITTTGATINFTTDQTGNARVEYGTTAGNGDTTPLDTTFALNHSVTLSNLTPGTLYHYRIITNDEIDNETITSDETFTTGSVATADAGVTVPESVNSGAEEVGVSASVIISAVDTVSLSTSSATITWHTDLPSDSQIEYGDSDNFGSLSTLSTTLTTSHLVTLSSLTQNTNYIFRVKSKPLGLPAQAGASVATVSGNYEFDTLNHSIPVVAPANIFSVSSGSVTGSGAAISWTTDKGTTSQVEYGTDTAYGSSSANSETLATSHSVLFNNLSPGTTYHYRVKSIDEAGNVTFSEDYTFATAGSPSNVGATPSAPVITDEGETPIVEARGVDGEVVFEINDGNPAVNEDVVIERDNQIIYEGNSETFTDTNLQNGVAHNYTVFARSSAGSSGSVAISIAPVAGVREVKFNESGTLASSSPALHFVKQWQKGDTDIEIEHLQEILVADKDSYPEKYITGYFGPLTEAALRRFQAKHGLPQTGTVNAATQQKLNTVSHSETKLDISHDYVVFATDLKRGDQGDSVKDLQQYLIYEGSYKEAIVSGYFGDLTYGAVKIFQTKYNIYPVSGIVGPKTRHKMQQLVGL